MTWPETVSDAPGGGGTSLAPGGGYLIDRVVEGDTVTEVLNYVAFNKDDLIAKVRMKAELALRAGTITLDEKRNPVKPAVVLKVEEGKFKYVSTVAP